MCIVQGNKAAWVLQNSNRWKHLVFRKKAKAKGSKVSVSIFHVLVDLMKNWIKCVQMHEFDFAAAMPCEHVVV